MERQGRGPLFALWDDRDTFAGEDEPAVQVFLPWQAETATVTDAFGVVSTIRRDEDQLALAVSATPVFVE